MEKEQAYIQTDWAEVLRTKGIRARGYGIVPKYAMQDTDLEIRHCTHTCAVSPGMTMRRIRPYRPSNPTSKSETNPSRPV